MIYDEPNEKERTVGGDLEGKNSSGEEDISSKLPELSEDIDREQLAELYEKSFKGLDVGDIIEGTVVKMSDAEVLVDIGYKSEGVVDISEFQDVEGKLRIKIGDKVKVMIELPEDQEGRVVLSYEKAERMKIWDDIDQAYQKNETMVGKVISRVKGGLSVDIGVKAFLPGSQIDVRPVRDLDSFKGKEIKVKVIKLNKRRGNIVISRKMVVEEESMERRKKTLALLEEGKRVKGVVKNITEYGAFIDLGGIDGLLHITDMSWGRISHPSELFAVGDEIEVIVLKFDREKERVSLGYKQMTPDPWEKVTEKYPVGSRVRGRVVSLTDYGAFVEVEEGVEGLIHISEMSWNKRIKHPSRILTVGDTVEAVVLSIDPEQRRISLGLKQTEPNPWQLISERYNVGDVIKGRVRNITDFGAFIEVEEGIDGLIHISDMSWTKKIKHPSEVLKKGEEVEAVILHIDPENQRLSLGLKQLSPNIWERFFSEHKVGDVVTGKIVRLTNFGAFVEIEEGIEGLVHVSELSRRKLKDLEKEFAIGQLLTMKISKMDFSQRKIGLSVAAYKAEEERKQKAQEEEKRKKEKRETKEKKEKKEKKEENREKREKRGKRQEKSRRKKSEERTGAINLGEVAKIENIELLGSSIAKKFTATKKEKEKKEKEKKEKEKKEKKEKASSNRNKESKKGK
jgi:small subunit ribosomal protein S1